MVAVSPVVSPPVMAEEILTVAPTMADCGLSASTTGAPEVIVRRPVALSALCPIPFPVWTTTLYVPTASGVVPARFKVGDRVRAKNMHPATHTRLPRYVRGHVGVVERNLGCNVFPDSAAVEAGEDPQWLYTVVFDGVELWGADSDPTVKVSIDAFEPYLEAA